MAAISTWFPDSGGSAGFTTINIAVLIFHVHEPAAKASCELVSASRHDFSPLITSPVTPLNAIVDSGANQTRIQTDLMQHAG